MSTSVSTRESDSQKTKDSLEYADITVSGLQKATSVLDNDAMQTSRLWEAAYSQPSTGSDQYANRAFSSGRVAFAVPSNYFDSLSRRALIETGTMESVYSELLKIEEFYQHELKEGRRPSEVNEKIRLALVQKIAELKATGSLK